MRSGQLRQRLDIERDGGTQTDPLGGRTEKWEGVLSVRAKSTYQGGREFERAKQLVADVSSVIIIRYDSRLEPLSGLQSMRLRNLDSDVIQRILYAADPTGRRREITIYVNEGQSR